MKYLSESIATNYYIHANTDKQLFTHSNFYVIDDIVDMA